MKKIFFLKNKDSEILKRHDYLLNQGVFKKLEIIRILIAIVLADLIIGNYLSDLVRSIKIKKNIVDTSSIFKFDNILKMSEVYYIIFVIFLILLVKIYIQRQFTYSQLKRELKGKHRLTSRRGIEGQYKSVPISLQKTFMVLCNNIYVTKKTKSS